MRIVRLEEVRGELQRHIRNNALFPIIGSGFSKGCKSTGKSGSFVPSGSEMKEYMIQYLKERNHKLSMDLSFSRVARYYEEIADPTDYWTYFKNGFTSVELPESRKSFLAIKWKFVYTLNLDDAIENNSRYQFVVLPGKNLRLDALESFKCVFKLHGDAKDIIKYYGTDNAVLSITEYISSLNTSRSMLEKLAKDLNYSNALFIGCSLDDELDILSVAQQLKERSGTAINRYFITSKVPDAIQQIDLKDYGIDTVIVADDYELFYEQFAELAKECELVQSNELDQYRNFATMDLPAGKDVEFLLSGRFLCDLKTHTIWFPSFFVTRELERVVLNEMNSTRIQIIHGSRISGKSYFLAGLVKTIKNRDVYYFDARTHIDSKLLKELFQKDESILLIDTNVLTKDAIRLLLDIDPSGLHNRRLNIVLCVNNSDRDVFQLVRDNITRRGNSSGVKTYKLDKKLHYRTTRDTVACEGDILNERLKLLGIPPFVKSNSILDNLIKLQPYMRSKVPTKFDTQLSVPVHDSEKLSLLILLVMNEKVTAQELVRCGLMQKNTELLQELKTSIEEDHCKLLSVNSIELVDYQVVCNAHVWLLEQLRSLSLTTKYDSTFEEAFILIVRSFLGDTKRFKFVEEYVKFDRLNEIFVNGKRLIQKIYDSLRPLLKDSYQYYHQYAKCRSWGMSSTNYDIGELDKAKNAGLTALRMVEERDIDHDIIHRMAYAHILNTVSIIFAKLCFLEGFSNRNTVNETSQHFLKAIAFPENYEAMLAAKNSRYRSKDEDGGVLKKWIEFVVEHPESVPWSAKDRVAKITAYWRSL